MLCIDRILFLQKGLFVFELFGGVLGRKTLENRKQETGTGNRKQKTGNRKQETGNRKQETGNGKYSQLEVCLRKGKTGSSSSSSLKLHVEPFLALGIALAHI